MKKKPKPNFDETIHRKAEYIAGVNAGYVEQSIKNDFCSLVLTGEVCFCVTYARILSIASTSMMYPIHNVANDAKCFYTLQGRGSITVCGQRMKTEKGTAFFNI